LNNTIEQTLTSTSNSISSTGGFNLLKNTQFFLGGEEWSISVDALYTVSQSAEVEENTVSKSELILSDGTFSQAFQNEVGKIYTISGKYKHTANDVNESGIRFYTSATVYTDILLTTTDVTNRTEFSYTYTASINAPTIQIHSDNCDFYLSDLIVQNGESKVWTPNVQEVRGVNYVLNQDGQRLYNISNTNLYSQTDSNSFDVYNDGTLLGSYGETFEAESGSLNSNLTINNLLIQHASGNLYFIG
jgi:hypothetical protein